MAARAICLLIGYACGCFLTADAVMRARMGKSAFAVGSRNPGMANVGALLGAKWAAVVLAGDIAKTILAVVLAALACSALPSAGGLLQPLIDCPWGVAFPHSGCLCVVYAGIGVVCGHDFPVWHGFSGGKGVTATCSAIILFNPLLGGLACLAGLAVVAAAHTLGVAALVIVCVFATEMAVVAAPAEILAFAVALALLAVVVWYRGRGAARSNETRT